MRQQARGSKVPKAAGNRISLQSSERLWRKIFWKMPHTSGELLPDLGSEGASARALVAGVRGDQVGADKGRQL